MLDINSFTTSVKNQILGWLSSIGTNLICPLIAAVAAVYCIFQIPQLFKCSGTFFGRRSSVLLSSRAPV